LTANGEAEAIKQKRKPELKLSAQDIEYANEVTEEIRRHESEKADK
jgi:hypothetical protein